MIFTYEIVLFEGSKKNLNETRALDYFVFEELKEDLNERLEICKFGC